MAILKDLKITGKNAWSWFKKNVSNLSNSKQIRNIKRNDLMKDTDYMTRTLEMGNMYMFRYDPKHKKTLPYYDTYPLIIPLERYKDGFLGLNLHYLPPKLRLALFEKLLTLATNKRMNKSTKIRATYNLLNASSRYKLMKPTIKRYLNKHIRSMFIKIDPSDWKIAIFLPHEGFVKQSKTAVWKDSTRMVS